MKKTIRLFSILLCFTIVLAFPAAAASTRSSSYFNFYRGTLSSAGGTLTVKASTAATDTMTTLGVASIKIVDASTNKTVKTFYGSTSNEMLSSGRTFSCTVTYSATRGTEYYAVIQFVAEDSSGSEYATYITSTTTA